MQVRRDIMTQQSEETRYRKRLVAISQHLEIDRVFVEQEAQEADDRVDGYHEQDSDDVPLLPWSEIVRRMLEDEEEGDEDGDGGEDEREEEAEMVESEAVPERFFAEALFQRCVAVGEVVHGCVLGAKSLGTL